MNQGKKMAEIRANWCHNSDMHKSVEINQAARSYLKGSYEVEMFLRISIYKTADCRTELSLQCGKNRNQKTVAGKELKEISSAKDKK